MSFRASELGPSREQLLELAPDLLTASKTVDDFVSYAVERLNEDVELVDREEPEALALRGEALEDAVEQSGKAESALNQELAQPFDRWRLVLDGAWRAVVEVGLLYGEQFVLWLTFADYLGVDTTLGMGSAPGRAALALLLSVVALFLFFVFAWMIFTRDEARSLRGIRLSVVLGRVAGIAGLAAAALFLAPMRAQFGGTATFRVVSIFVFPIVLALFQRLTGLRREHGSAAAALASRVVRRRAVRQQRRECRRSRRYAERGLTAVNDAIMVHERFMKLVGYRERQVRHDAEVAFAHAERRQREQQLHLLPPPSVLEVQARKRRNAMMRTLRDLTAHIDSPSITWGANGQGIATTDPEN